MTMFVGQPEKVILSQFGPPDASYEAGGVKYLTYSQSSVTQTAGVAPSYTSHVYGNVIYTSSWGGVAPRIRTNWCKVVWEISNGVVQRLSYSGNACLM